MKKLFSLLTLLLLAPFLTACELSNTDIANSLEGNMTRLVYSVGYLDSISTDELSNLVNNSSYFTHSSLYTNNTITEVINDTKTTSTMEPESPSALEGGLLSNNQILSVKANPHRTRSYKSSILNNSSVTDTETALTNVGVVDMSLLETSSTDLNNILLEISSKRGIIMLYCTDLRSGRATLPANDKKALHEYDNIIQETTNYLNNTMGALLNQFNGISSISTTENSAELINSKLIRANEVLKTRYAKLDTCLDSLDAIINILVNNIGFEYMSMYNNQSTNNISLDTTPSTLTSNTTITNPPTTTTTPTEPDSNITPTLNTTTSCCPICKSQNCTCNNSKNICPICKKEICSCNKANQINAPSLTTPNDNSSDNTIINYNYEGQNSATIATPTTSTYPMNRPQTSTSITTQTTTANSLTETEIALNGGLVKNTNNDKISKSNAENFIIDSSANPPAGAYTKDHKTDPNLDNYSYPFKTLEETSHNFPITNDIRDEEFIESERELTPEILPFSGVTESHLKQPQNLTNTSLGLINLLPFQYEEENVIKRIPRQ